MKTDFRLKLPRYQILEVCQFVLSRNHLFPFWLGLTLGYVTIGVTVACSWHRQLPDMFGQAVAEKNFLACFRHGEQLAKFHSLNSDSLKKQAVCRRHLAELAWQRKDYREALMLQKQLVNSRSGSRERQLLNRRRLLEWSGQLWSQALTDFKTEDLKKPTFSLNPLGWLDNSFSNRLNYAPWWQQMPNIQRQLFSANVARNVDYAERHSHNFRPEHTIPVRALDWVVTRQLQQGMDTWRAFEFSCRDLGGYLIEKGPETLCW